MMKMAVKRDVEALSTVWQFTLVRVSEVFSAIINKCSLNVVCQYYSSSNYIIRGVQGRMKIPCLKIVNNIKMVTAEL